MAKNDGIALMSKIHESENRKAFFDRFVRLEQKSRLHGRYPEMETIIRLHNYKELFL